MWGIVIFEESWGWGSGNNCSVCDGSAGGIIDLGVVPSIFDFMLDEFGSSFMIWQSDIWWVESVGTEVSSVDGSDEEVVKVFSGAVKGGEVGRFLGEVTDVSVVVEKVTRQLSVNGSFEPFLRA